MFIVSRDKRDAYQIWIGDRPESWLEVETSNMIVELQQDFFRKLRPRQISVEAIRKFIDERLRCIHSREEVPCMVHEEIEQGDTYLRYKIAVSAVVRFVEIRTFCSPTPDLFPRATLCESL